MAIPKPNLGKAAWGSFPQREKLHHQKYAPAAPTRIEKREDSPSPRRNHTENPYLGRIYQEDI